MVNRNLKRMVDISQISILVALIIIGSFIKIPSPFSGVFTLQLEFLFLGAVLLGHKKGVIASLVYLIGGTIGIPWFALGGGFHYVLQPTYGFLVSFVVGALIVGLSKDKKLYIKIIFSIIGTFIVWLIGMLYYVTITKFFLGKEMSYFLVIKSIFSLSILVDLVLVTVISIISTPLSKALKKAGVKL